MGECKAKAIQTNLGTFRHNQTYSDIFRSLCYADIFYNCDISRTLTYSEPEAYSESLSHIYDEALIIFTVVNVFTNYNYFLQACRVEMNILR